LQVRAQCAAVIAAGTFRLDVKGAEIRGALLATGLRPVLLKGRPFANLLYGESESRDYSDVDLLVSPGDATRAQQVLRAEGFRPSYGSAPIDPQSRQVVEGSLHGGAWYRKRDGLTIDLHHTLPQVVADPWLVWSEITRHTMSMNIGGAATDVLDRPASALLVALHAAHHGVAFGSAVEDPRRAAQRFDFACWSQARDLASKLDATAAMGIGLGLTPEGSRIAEDLGLSTVPTFGLLLRWNDAPWGSNFIEAMAAQSGIAKRLGLLIWLLWPRPAALRLSSPLARRSRRGLVVAYAIRPAQLARRAPAALAAWRRTRRSISQ
jgi:hypothetical protein